MNGISPTFDLIAKVIDRYDCIDLLAKVGALQLVPANVAHMFRLEALAHVVASCQATAARSRISQTQLDSLCNKPPLGESVITSGEDPAEQPFSEALAYFGGSYVVFPGLVTDATFTLRHLCTAVFHIPNSKLPSHYASEAHCAIGAILALSNAVAERAGIRRNQPTPRLTHAGVLVPSDMDRLQKAVVFTMEELQDLLAPSGIPMQALAPFTILCDPTIRTRHDGECGPLHAKPIIHASDKWIVGLPGALLAALRHHLIALALEQGVANKLAAAYQTAIWKTVNESFLHLGAQPGAMPSGLPPSDRRIREGVWTLDTDSVSYVSVLSDDLSDYEKDDVFGHRKSDGIRELLEERQGAVETALFEHHPRLNNILIVYLQSGLGRSLLLGFNHRLEPFRSYRVWLSVSELETIALTQSADPLVLWKFARAAEAIRDQSQIFAWSTLDEFGLYEKRSFSYYLTDDKRPTFINVASDMGAELRQRLLDTYDFHAAPFDAQGNSAEVMAVHGTLAIPIYMPRRLVSHEHQFLVEGLPFPLWISADTPDETNPLHFIRHARLGIVDLIAYWFWQFTPSLGPILSEESHLCRQPVHLHIELVNVEQWSDDSQNADPEVALQVKVHPTDWSISVIVGPGVKSLLSGADNQGERAIMARVVGFVGDLLEKRGSRATAEKLRASIPDILERHAPLGFKKKLSLLSLNSAPVLDPNHLPRFRPIQRADTATLRDEIATFVGLTLHLPSGVIDPSQRTLILGKIVGWLYGQLQHLISTLNPSTLLPFIIAHNEAIAYAKLEQQFELPAQLACFQDQQDLTDRFTQRLLDINSASAASRFLLEYVVARPPHGYRPISLSVYDQLLALAAEIVYWAQESDLIQYGVEETTLEVLPSGRLSAARPRYQRAEQAFIPQRSREEVQRAIHGFSRFWQPHQRDNTTGGTPPLVAQINKVTKDEYGWSLADTSRLLAEIYNLGLDIGDSPSKSMEYSAVVRSLADRLLWSTDQVEGCLQLLVLSPRADFLVPPPPYSKEDVYPWRYTRAMSCLRRPLFETTSSDQRTLIWGNRHVLTAIDYTIDLMLGGRLQARSKTQAMRALIGTMQSQANAEFVEAVAKDLRRFNGLEVHTNVRKIGSLRIGQPANDLGDIDVFVIWRKKQRIFAIECKDIFVARTPRELANELTELFRDTTTKASVATRHMRRVDWLRDNIARVCQHYEIASRVRWTVKPMMVLREGILSAHLATPPFPVYSVESFSREFVDGYLAKEARLR